MTLSPLRLSSSFRSCYQRTEKWSNSLCHLRAVYSEWLGGQQVMQASKPFKVLENLHPKHLELEAVHFNFQVPHEHNFPGELAMWSPVQLAHLIFHCWAIKTWYRERFQMPLYELSFNERYCRRRCAWISFPHRLTFTLACFWLCRYSMQTAYTATAEKLFTRYMSNWSCCIFFHRERPDARKQMSNYYNEKEWMHPVVGVRISKQQITQQKSFLSLIASLSKLWRNDQEQKRAPWCIATWTSSIQYNSNAGSILCLVFSRFVNTASLVSDLSIASIYLHTKPPSQEMRSKVSIH